MTFQRNLVALSILAALGFLCCQPAEKNETAGALPLHKVLAAARPPVEIQSITLSLASSVVPTFNVTVKNVTDMPVTSVLWTAVLFDKSGNPIPEGSLEGGYSDPLDPIAAGEARELSFTAPAENAARVKLVLKEVVFETPNPMGKDYPGLPHKWTNAFYDAELRQAEGLFVFY